MRPKVISLFCGAGGCSLGFKQSGYSILYATDKDEAAIGTYQRNFPTTTCVQEDINNLDFHQILTQAGLDAGELDILIGGPPCQGFSTAGARFWADPRNHLLKSYVKALEIIRPKWFLMENVEGLLTSNGGLSVYETVKAVVELGYQVRLEKTYAQEYGIPQRRKRVIIVGNCLGIDFKMPEPTTHIFGQIFRNSGITVGDAIIGLPAPATEKNKTLKYTCDASNDLEVLMRADSGCIEDHYTPEIDGVQLKRILSLKPGQTMKNLPDYLQHDSFKKRANRRVADGVPTEKRGGAPSGLKRLKANEPCLTITGAATRELIHPTEARPLTIRECARIQTFPDSFSFCGSASQKMQQIANAIPPLLARVFADHIQRNYGFNTIEYCEGKLLGYALTKADAMSPALKKTDSLLQGLLKNKKNMQLQLF